MKSKTQSRTLVSFAGNYKILTVVGCILSGISAILTLMPFICIWKIVEEIFKVIPNIEQAENITFYGILAVVFAIARMVLYWIGLICTHIAAFHVARRMRQETLHHILKLPIGYIEQYGSGRLRRIIDESAGQTESFLAHQLPDLTGAYITPVAMLVILLTVDWKLGLLSMIPIAISFIFMRKMMGSGLKTKMAEYQDALESMNNEAVEYIRGIPVVKTFQQSIYSFESFHKAILRYKKWAVDYTISLRIPMTGFTVAINSIFALLLPAGILLLESAKDPEAFLLKLIFYIIYTPFCTLMLNRILFSSENAMLAQDAVKRINQILDARPLKEPEQGRKPKEYSVTFDRVSFCYENAKKNAVDNVSFHVAEGKTLALVGASGGGKSTIASLIPRFWDVSDGAVRVGGVDVKEIGTTELMNDVSFVFQDVHLFKMSLYDNIRCAKPEASMKEIISAARAAQCDTIFEQLPHGMYTEVGSKGVYLSGGEAQRIALARAILKDAPILVLDEATAFTDPDNEHLIQKALSKLIVGKTVIMIAHRLSTIKHADSIAVVENGKIVEQGTHEELLLKQDRYATMWREYQSSINWKVVSEEKQKEEGEMAW